MNMNFQTKALPGLTMETKKLQHIFPSMNLISVHSTTFVHVFYMFMYCLAGSMSRLPIEFINKYISLLQYKIFDHIFTYCFYKIKISKLHYYILFVYNESKEIFSS